MKNKIFTTAILAVLILALSSCRKCEICTQESEPEIRVCQGDYNSNTEFNLTLDGLEALGYRCR